MRKVTISPPGGQAFVIGDDALGRGVGSKLITLLLPRFDAAVQQAAYVRGDAPENFDRKQDIAGVTVEVTYCFAGFDVADDFLFGLQAAVPRIGTLTISTTGPSGNQTRVLTKCWCRPIEAVAQIGETVVVRFQFSGGLLSTSFLATPDPSSSDPAAS